MKGFVKFLAVGFLCLPVLASAMDVRAKSAIVMDAQTGKILWSREADTARYPASTTKIMTALLLLEHSQPDDVIVGPPEIETIGEASMHLKPGERVSAHDMMYALLIRSANDGAYAVAKHVSGSIPAFADLMNERARQIGCTNTHFHNPNGLNDPQHTTTAHDLALMAREAMRNSTFAEVAKTTRYQIARTINNKDTWMVTRNKWLKADSTADGIKTGFTNPAGHCFVGAATRNGYRVITVVMKSPQWQKDTEEMLDWAFKTHERLTLAQRETPLTRLAVTGGTQSQISVGAVSPVDTLLRKSTVQRVGGHMAVEPMMASSPPKAPIAKGTALGEAIVRDAEGFEQKVELVALEDVPEAGPLVARGAKGGLRFDWLAIGGTIAAGTIVAQKKLRFGRRMFGRKTAKRSF